MPLRLSESTMKAVEARLGREAAGEVQEAVIFAFMPEHLRRIVTLTTPHLDEQIGIDVARELKDWVISVARSVCP